MAQLRFSIAAVLTVIFLSPQEHALSRQGDAPARPEAVVDNGEFMDMSVDRKEWASIYQRATRLAEMQNLLFFRNRDEVKDPRWAALSAGGRQSAADLAAAALLGLRNLQKADYEGVRKKYVAVAEACNACHREFARGAPTIKP